MTPLRRSRGGQVLAGVAGLLIALPLLLAAMFISGGHALLRTVPAAVRRVTQAQREGRRL